MIKNALVLLILFAMPVSHAGDGAVQDGSQDNLLSKGAGW